MVVSVALFALIWRLSASRVYVPGAVGFLVPAVSVMACALGVGWRRKTLAIALMLGGFTVFDVVTRATGIQTLASKPLAGGFAEQAVLVGGIVYAMVPLVYPFAVLVLFVGRRPSLLWTGREPSRSAVRQRSRARSQRTGRP